MMRYLSCTGTHRSVPSWFLSANHPMTVSASRPSGSQSCRNFSSGNLACSSRMILSHTGDSIATTLWLLRMALSNLSIRCSSLMKNRCASLHSKLMLPSTAASVSSLAFWSATLRTRNSARALTASSWICRFSSLLESSSCLLHASSNDFSVRSKKASVCIRFCDSAIFDGVCKV